MLLCSQVGGGLSGWLWMWGRVEEGAGPQRDQRWLGRCSRGELGEVPGNGRPFGLKQKKEKL